ncbi:MAG: hypothetical protein ACI8WB_000851 [Phenylobacterium sp.]|jgi:hypothetical protein
MVIIVKLKTLLKQSLWLLSLTGLSAYAAPDITSSTYDHSTGALVVTGSGFVATAGVTNDVDVTKIKLKGSNAFYNLTSSNVEITSGTEFTVILNGIDRAIAVPELPDDGTAFNPGGLNRDYALQADDGFIPAAAGAVSTDQAITASNATAASITSVTYDTSSGVLVATGIGFAARNPNTGNPDTSNDVNLTKLAFTGSESGTYTLTGANIDVTSSTEFSATLGTTDKNGVNALLNQNGTASVDATTYNIAAASGYLPWTSGTTPADATTPVTASGFADMSSATYDHNTGTLVVTGSGFVATAGATNDVDVTKIKLKGSNAFYNLTSTNVEITSATEFSVALNGIDRAIAVAEFPYDGTAFNPGGLNRAYTLQGDEGFIAAAAGAVSTDKPINVSNVVAASITSATYDTLSGVLTVTGVGFASRNPNTGNPDTSNDVNLTKLTFTGEAGGTYTLTGANIDVTSNTAFTTTLGTTDINGINALLNKNGTSSADATAYNIAGASGYLPWTSGTTPADATSAVTASGLPEITSATFDLNTGSLVVTGNGFVATAGADNDIDATKLIVGFDGARTSLLTLATTTNVEITDSTSFTVAVAGRDYLRLVALYSSDGTTTSAGGNDNPNVLQATSGYMAASAGAVSANKTVNVSNYAAPAVTGVAYDYTTGILVVTGTKMGAHLTEATDTTRTQIRLTGKAGSTFNLNATSEVALTSTTTLTIPLHADDKAAVNLLLDTNGTVASDFTTYDFFADNAWLTGQTSFRISTLAMTVSNAPIPASIETASYDASTGVLVVAGTLLQAKTGLANDIDASKLVFTGDAGISYTLTDTTDVELTDASGFTLTLSATDKRFINGLLNKDGASADSGATYNLAGTAGYLAEQLTYLDTTATINVSNVALPTVTSATYDYGNATLVVTGTNFVSKQGSDDDIDATKFTFTGEGGQSHTLTADASNVDITSDTALTLTVDVVNQAMLNYYLNKDGTASNGATTYNLAVADNWMVNAPTSQDTVDATNGISVSNLTAPTISEARYDFDAGSLNIRGFNLVRQPGDNNDVDPSKLTLKGQGGVTYTLTTSAVDHASNISRQLIVLLNAEDKLNVNGLFNQDDASALDGTAYNLAVIDNWQPGALATLDLADTTTVLNVSSHNEPTINSATYDYNTGNLVVTGDYFVRAQGVTNDVDVTKLTLKGEADGVHVLSSPSVEVTSQTAFTVALSASDKAAVNGLLNKSGTLSNDAKVYNLSAANSFLPTATGTADTSNAVTVSNFASPDITLAAYDGTAGTLTVTGTGFVSKAGAANDTDLTKLTITGEGAGTYVLTSTNVELTSAESFVVTLNAADTFEVNSLLNKDGTTAGDSTAYNLAAADNYLQGAIAATDLTDATNGMTVSNVAIPTITSATYDATSGALVVTGSNLLKKTGATNDVLVTKLSLAGEGGSSYTLSSADVEVTSGTAFTVTVNAADKLSINGLLNKNGTASGDSTTYNLAAAEDWVAGAAAATVIADLSGNGVTVSNVVNPTITSATYDAATAVLTVTGTNLVNKVGVTNDVDVTKLALKGEAAGTYTLTTTNVEITSETAFSVTLNSTDKLAVAELLNKNGTSADDSTAYNLAATDNWMVSSDSGVDIADATNAVDVSNVPVATITSATYDATTGVLAVTATNLSPKSGADNDIDITKLTLMGEASATYALTSSNVEVSGETAFSVTLNAADKLNINGLLNKDGVTADGGATYNLAAAEDWLAGAAASANIVDATGNAITVSNVAIPAMTSAVYDATSGALVVTGTGFAHFPGATNDVDVSTLTVTGEGGSTYTLTSATDVEVTSNTAFSVTLSGADKTNVDGLLNKNGTVSDTSSTAYNLAGADNWHKGSAASVDNADASNAVTVSNVTVPTLTSATYDVATGSLVVTATNLRNKAGATNDVDVSTLSVTGEGGSYTLTSATDVDIASATTFTVVVAGADKLALDGVLNKDGTTSDASVTYNLAAADNWQPSVLAVTDSKDLTGNGVTVSNVALPTLTSSTYSFTTGVLSVTGTLLNGALGNNNDVDPTKLSLMGEGGNSYTLTGSMVEVTSNTAFSVTLPEADKININGLLNKDGTSSEGATAYNLAGADNWLAGAAATTDIADSTGNAVTVSAVVPPVITSMSYDSATGVLTVTGTNFVKLFGNSNDIDISTFTFTGENGQTYTLTSATDIDISSSTTFTFTLAGGDKSQIDLLLNLDGGQSNGGTTYNVAAADNWMGGSAASTDISDATGNAVTVANAKATITSATYDVATASLVVTGQSFFANAGATNDVTVSTISLKGEGGTSYALTSANVDITSATEFTVVLNAADSQNINGLLNKDGTSSEDATTYNIAVADDFMAARTSGDSSDLTGNAMTVSNVAIPTITTAIYDATSGALVVTGTGLAHKTGVNNDVDISTLTLTGEGGATVTLTGNSDIDISTSTTFTVTLTGADKMAVDGLLNKDGISSDDANVYNLAGADNWLAAAAASSDIADVTANAITVSNVIAPTLTSATYDATTGILTATGTNLRHKTGAANDVDVSLFTFTGEAGATYTLTSAVDVEISSATAFTATLTGADKTNVDGLLNKNGTASDNATVYNLAAADNWMPSVLAATDSADATDNGITVSLVTVPAITSATYDGTSGVLAVTATNLRSLSGTANDVDASKLILVGQGSSSHTLTSTSVDITSDTAFSLTLNSADQAAVAVLLNKNGSSAVDNTVYNLAAADNWLPGAAASTDTSDLTANAVTLSNASTPTVTLTASVSTMAEAAGTSVITATLSAATTETITVNLAYTGTATGTADYSGHDATLTIASGQLQASLTLTATQDTTYEGATNETLIVDISSVSTGASESGSQQQALSIVEDDALPNVTLTASSTTLAEASGTSTLTATLNIPTISVVTVNLGYTGTSASTDFAAATSITIAAGQTTGTTTVTASQDSLVEGPETLIAAITDVTGALENASQQQTLTISDDETVSVSLAVNQANMAEAAGTSTLTATLNEATYENVVVSLGYTGSATNGTDYATGVTSVTIAAGQTSATTTLTATQDSLVEGNETIIAAITNVSGGAASENGIQSQTINLADDETVNVSLSVSVAAVAEAAGTSTLTATLSKATFENVVVTLGYTGSAINGTDYATPATSLTIVAGQTSATTTLTASQDALVEGPQTIIAAITGVTGGAASENGVQSQTLTITDDETVSVTLTASSASMAEAATSTLTATLDQATFETVTVGLSYSGTATSGIDYATGATSITIAAGQTTANTTLTATQDSLVEVSETIIASISNVTGGSASSSGSQSQTLTITDDDTTTVSIAVSSNALSENSGTVTVTTNLSQSTFADVAVALSFSGSATLGTDYTTSATTLVIPAGQSQASVTLSATQDNIIEGNESLIVVLASVSGGSSVASSANQIIVLADDDTISATLAISSASVAEATGTSEVTVSLNQANFEAVTINFGLSGTASTSDYSLAELTIAAGQTSGTATLTATQDEAIEEDETVIIDIASITSLGGNTTVVENGIQQQTLTIVDDDGSTSVTLALSQSELTEAGTSTLTATLSKATTADVIVTLATSGTAISGTDYLALPDTLTIVQGETSASLTISAIQDPLEEADETIIVDIASVSGADAIESEPQQVTLTLLNDDNQTGSDTASVDEDTSVTIDVLANDVTSGSSLNPASVTIVTEPANGTTSINTANGFVTYTPKADINGSDTFSYTVSDLAGNVSASTAVTITITPINDAPVAANDTTSTTEDTALVIDVLANDTDVDGQSDIDSATLVMVTEPANGTASIVDGKFDYTPNANTSGSDSFGYTVADKAGLRSDVASVSINVIGANDAPTTVVDTATLDEDTQVSIAVLSNDSDIDGTLNVASVVIVANPANGEAVPQADGQIIYTPAANFAGTDTFTYTVKDDLDAMSAATTVTLTVNAVNDAPVAQNDVVTVLEDAPHTINVTGNDSDVDGTIASVVVVTEPTNGVVTMDGLNLIYTPGNQFSGSDGFSYTVTDNDNAVSNVASVELTISAVNDAPLANNDSAQTSQGQAVTIDVLSNDSDIDGQLDSTSVVVSNGPANGSTAVASNGQITYTPTGSFAGTDSFDYQVTDNEGATSTATVTITVTNVNDAPVANDQTINTVEDTEVGFSLDGSDADGDTLTYTLLSQPQNGTLTGTGGNMNYTPAANVSGTESFTYSVNDGLVESNTATVTIIVAVVNDAPTVVDQSVNTNEDSPLTITLAGSDIEGDALTFTVASGPSNGQLSGTAADLTYTPNANFNGSDSFTYTANDGALDSNTATVSISIGASNDAPQAIAQALTLREDQSVSVTLTGSDIDGNGLTFTALTNPTNGILSGQGADLLYTPNGDFNGSDSFTFVANDGLVDSAAATVALNISAINDAPQAVNDSVTQDNRQAVTLNVLANDSDVDGDTITITGASVSAGAVSFTATNVTYTPTSGFNGTATVRYQISDGQLSASALAFVTVSVPGEVLPVITVPADVTVNATGLQTKVDLGVATAVDVNGNSVPVALLENTRHFKPGVHTVIWTATDSVDRTSTASQQVNVVPMASLGNDKTVLEGFAASVNVRLNGPAPVYPVSIPYTVTGTATSGVDHDLADGTLIIPSGNQATLAFNVLRDSVFEGDETIILTLGSTSNRGNRFTQTVTINEQNVAPAVSLTMMQANEARFVLSADSGEVVITAAITHPDVNNQFSIDWRNQEFVLSDTDSVDNTFTFDPSGLTPGVYHVSTTVIDLDDTAFGSLATVTFTVEAAATVLVDTTDTDNDGIPDNVDGLGDTDNDGIPNYLDAIPECNVLQGTLNSSNQYLVEGEAGVCMRLGDTALTGETGGARIIDNTDTTTPNVGGVYDFIVYGLTPGQSFNIVFPQIQPIPANALYRKKTAAGDWQDFVENQSNQLLSTAGESGYCPPPGDASWNAGLTEGHWCVQIQLSDGGPNDTDGEVNGTIVDPGGVAAIANNNTVPTATDDVVSTRLNTPLTIDVLANDTDGDNDNLSISSANATFGAVSIVDNQLDYVPADAFFGVDTIIYGVTDGNGGSASASVTVNVQANGTPVATADSASGDSGTAIIIDVISNDIDPDGDSISIVAATAVNGTVSIGADNSLTYQSNDGFSGEDSITYRLRDSLGAEAVGTVTVTVNAVIVTPPTPPTPTPVEPKRSSGGSLAWMLFAMALVSLRRQRVVR